MNTKPPAPPIVRSVWTQKDELLLKELTERRQRIMDANMDALVAACAGCCASSAEMELVSQTLAGNAAAVIAALKPFVEPE
jgi:hypothetical protein